MSFLKKEVTLPKLSKPKLGTPKLRTSKRGTPKSPRRTSHPRSPSRGLRSSGVVGLEIGATQIIAAEAGLQDGRIVAQRLVRRELPLGLVRDGIVLEPMALAAELKALFSEHKLGRRVRVGLATPRTVLRVIDLPPLAEEDVAAALTIQAQDRIPMPLDRAVLDHQTVGLIDTPDGQRLQVIVVATERTAVDVLLEALRQAALKPQGIDLSVFAAIRAVSAPGPAPGAVLYAQLGDLVNIAIAQSGVCRFTRQAPQGLVFVLERLVEARGGTIAEARELLLRAAGDDLDAADRDDVREVSVLLGRIASELGSELRAAAEFYGTQSAITVSEGVVTGTLASLRGFVPALAEASGLELRCGEVTTAADAQLGVDPRVAPVAVGLCVENVV